MSEDKREGRHKGEPGLCWLFEADELRGVQMATCASTLRISSFHLDNADSALSNSQMGESGSMIPSSAGPSNSAAHDLLKQLSRARADPSGISQYKRNKPHLCSFYAKGNCNRGDACPFRHELPVQNEMSQQNIKDR